MDTIQFAPRNIKSSVEMLRIDRPGDAEPMDLGRVLKGYGVNLPHLLEVYCAGCKPPLKPGRDDKAESGISPHLSPSAQISGRRSHYMPKGPDGSGYCDPGQAVILLDKARQNSNHANRGNDDNNAQSTHPGQNCRPQRIEAIKLLNRYQMLPPDARKEIGVCLTNTWRTSTTGGVLGDPDNPGDDLPCLNPIQRPGPGKWALKKYDLFLKSREYYRDGVFHPHHRPGRFTSLWHANRHFSIAFNDSSPSSRSVWIPAPISRYCNLRRPTRRQPETIPACSIAT